MKVWLREFDYIETPRWPSVKRLGDELVARLRAEGFAVEDGFIDKLEAFFVTSLEHRGEAVLLGLMPSGASPRDRAMSDRWTLQVQITHPPIWPAKKKMAVAAGENVFRQLSSALTELGARFPEE